MKKLLFFLILFSGFAFGQEFMLTPDNFKNKSDETKNYIVLEFPGLTQKELFDKAKMFIHSKFKNLKGDGLNEVEPSQLKIRSRVVGSTVKVFGDETITSYLITTYELGFKDGKIMIKPHFDEFEGVGPDRNNNYLNGGNAFAKSIYNKKAEIWIKHYYNIVNEKTNQFVSDLKNSMLKKEDW